MGERNGDSECAATHKYTWRFSGQERFEECLMLACKNSLNSIWNKSKLFSSVFLCKPFWYFRRKRKKFDVSNHHFANEIGLRFQNILCRLVSSPMVDAYAKTYHTILGSLQSSMILPSRSGKYAHTQHRYNSQFKKKNVLCCTYISHKNGLAMRWKRVNNLI